LVAHRGNAAEYPENTLEALRSAVDLGVRHVEFDVQLPADAIPVVVHDSSLDRVAGRPGCVHDLRWAELADVAVGEPGRFARQFDGVRMPSLAQVVEALGAWNDVTGFVEVKRASLRRFGHDLVLNRIAATVAPALDRCVLISFDLECVRRLRAMTNARIGWVVERYDEATHALAVEAAPDFLFGDVDALPPTLERLWVGPWEWAIYEVRDVATASRCKRLGAPYVETMCVRAMREALEQARAS
jgi:glycerophosphoryl diester phosphodiesterase